MALALRNSIVKEGNSINFRVVFVDDSDSGAMPFPQDEIKRGVDVTSSSTGSWENRAFQYDVVELCTSIKPLACKFFLNLGFDRVVYVDPDVYFFGDPKVILSEMEGYDVLLTPHKLDISDDDPLRGGIFNLGFIALANTSNVLVFLDWWAKKLEQLGSADPLRGYFTDQKWVDFAPVVLDDNTLKISRNPGLNIAPWNYEERAITFALHVPMVKTYHRNREIFDDVIFCHFSGYDYMSLVKDQPPGTSKNGTVASVQMETLLSQYGKALRKCNFEGHFKTPYQYGHYSDGHPISYSDRRIFKRLLLENLAAEFYDPFDAGGAFRALLCRSKLLLPREEKDPEKVRASGMRSTAALERAIDILTRVFILIFGYRRTSLLVRYISRFGHPENRARWLGGKYHRLRVRSF